MNIPSVVFWGAGEIAGLGHTFGPVEAVLRWVNAQRAAAVVLNTDW